MKIPQSLKGRSAADIIDNFKLDPYNACIAIERKEDGER